MKNSWGEYYTTSKNGREVDSPNKRIQDVEKKVLIPKYIDGWMESYNLFWLADQARKYYRIIELGSYLGKSTQVLAQNTPGFVLAVDNWLGHLLDRHILLEKFKSNVQDLISSGKIQILEIDHANLRDVGFTPDMIFIDGDHSYDSVCRDIRWAMSVIGKGGLICGHDYDFEDVKKAVQDTMESFTVPKENMWCRL